MPPRYSIVIPTRNRADLLKLAVRTVIAQSFDDYEVLVSDNASADHTAQVIASFRDSRIRSVRTPTSLVMPESWAFALSHARGEYVMFLCDDDALHPRALASIDAVANQTNADVIYWRWCHYQHADWSGSAGQDIFSFGPPFSDRVFNVNAERLLECAYDMRLSHNAHVPRMLNTAVHRSAIDRAREGSNGLGAQAPAANGIFRPASPDWAAMVALCAHAKRMAFLDAPLLVAGACAQSIGASATRRDEAARAYLRDIRARYPNLILPATTATLHCWMAQVFMQCAADMKLPGKAVNSVHMLGLAGQELAEWDRIGVRTDDLRAEFEHAVNELRIEDQEEVARIICGKIVLFSEEFLGTEVKCRVLGNGARVVEGGQAKAEGFESIVDFAVGIDQWMNDHGKSIEKFIDDIGSAAKGRNVLVYGMGANGWALERCGIARHPRLRGRIWCFDDRCDQHPTSIPRIGNLHGLDPREWFVVVTPYESKGIEGKLHEKRFEMGRDVISLGESHARAIA